VPPGARNQVPESGHGIIQPGEDAFHAFRPGTPLGGAEGRVTRRYL
jgi:hypothetical protein